MPLKMTPSIEQDIRAKLSQEMDYGNRGFGHQYYADQLVQPQQSVDYLAQSGIPLVADAAGFASDIKMFQDKPESRTPLNMGLSAMGLLPFVPALAGMTSWHGSPHKWDKVDLSKVGTGEGAQAYGHGFYSGEARSTGEHYKDALGNQGKSAQDTPYNVDGKKIYPDSVDQQVNYQAMLSGNDTYRDERLTFLREQASLQGGQADQYKKMALDTSNAEDISHYNNMADAMGSGYKKNNDLANELQAMIDSNVSVTPAGGHLYELDIDDAVIDKMLDWDAPLSEQMLSNLEKATGERRIFRPGMTGEKAYSQVQDYGSRRGFWDKGKDKGFDPYAGEVDVRPSLASDYLDSIGIPGIKYWDGTSRTAGKGTRNYVNFNADDITAISRNGELLLDELISGKK